MYLGNAPLAGDLLVSAHAYGTRSTLSLMAPAAALEGEAADGLAYTRARCPARPDASAPAREKNKDIAV